MYTRALNDATITIPTADLNSIVLSALGVAQDGTTSSLPGSSSSGVTVAGMSISNLLLVGAVAYYFLKK